MDEKKLIDDCFYIEKARWDVYHSYDKEEKRLITSLTEEGCINATTILYERSSGRIYGSNYSSGKCGWKTLIIHIILWITPHLGRNFWHMQRFAIN
jgi:hypothetical protein